MSDKKEELSPDVIGDRIRELRQKHGLDLKDISKATNISVDILRALEKGEWSRLGSKFLIKSFIKSYCEVLQEPSNELLMEIDHIGDYQCGVSTFKPLLASEKKTLIKNKKKSLFYLLVMFIAVFMVAGGIYVYRYNGMKSETIVPAEQETTIKIPKEVLLPGEKQAETEITSNENVEVASEPKGFLNDKGLEVSKPLSIALFEQEFENSQVPNEERIDVSVQQKGEIEPVKPEHLSHKLVIKAIEKTWIKVWVDEAKPTSKLLQPGDVMEFDVEKSARMVIGNAGGITLAWDNEVFTNLGKRGAVIKISIPADLKKKSLQ